MSNQKSTLFLFFILFFSLPTLVNSQSNATKTAFSFSLSNSARTSAGVFLSDGTLVRTLWSNKTYSAGSHVELWDGMTDDSTHASASQTYQIKVLSNNVQYTWEGVIGNTSDSLTGSTVLRAFDGIYGMAFAGGNVYYCTDYNEAWTANFKAALSSVQQKIHILETNQTSQQTDYVVTDGTYVYWGGCDAWSKAYTFVFATKVSNDTEATFTNGVSYKTAIGRTYKSAIDTVYKPNGTPVTIFNALSTITGMAVQKTGSYLFISRSQMNRVDVVNKTTGALVQKMSVQSPGELTIDGNDNLWMVSNNTVKKYSVNSNGTLSSAVLTLSGLLSPLSLSVSPDNTTLLVADGGTSQQIKAYSNSNGTSSWTLGRSGGYQSDPAVYNDKFYFVDRLIDTTNNASTFRAFVSFQPDGSFWVGDGGNYRAQHFSANKTFINNMMYLNHTYSCAGDPVNTSRVFNNFLEFKVDYSKPLASNNGSWILAKNWRDGIPQGYSYDKKVFNSMVTLSNGKTYAFLTNIANNSTSDLFELPATGNIRFTGIQLLKGVYKICTDGSLKSFNHGAVGTTATWSSQALNGFDASNNPVWSSVNTIASIATTSGGDPIDYNGGTPGNTTTSGMLVSFDNGLNLNGHGTNYHLGVIKLGSATNNKFLWKTSQITTTNYEGDFPDNGGFDVGNNVNYGGADVWAIDNNIFWNYHGESWKNSQTNKWNQYSDIGLSIGQFGVVTDDYLNQEAFPMGAGNVFTGVFAKDNGNYYLYHNDESVHGGLHRWKITGLNTIQVQRASFTSLSNVKVLPGIDLMAGLHKNTILADGTAGWHRNPKTEDYTSRGSKYWSVITTVKTFGYFTPNDLFITYRQGSGSASVTRDLGINNVANSWSVNGNFSWDGNYENESNNTGGFYIDILDNNAKIIARVYTKATNPNRYIYGNNSLIAQGATGTIQSVTKHNQNIDITVNSNGVTFTYANYHSITVPIFDSKANWKAPKTVSFNFFTTSTGSNYDRIIDIQTLRFNSNSLSSPTPPSPGDYYRSVASGNWSNVSTWQSSKDSISWVNATMVPSDTSNSITIQNGHTVDISGTVTVDQLHIKNGGTLNVTPNSAIIINDGTGEDIDIASGGRMVIKSDSTGTGRIGNSAGTVNGEATVERYLSSFNNVNYRVLAPSVNTAQGTKPYIRDNWQEGQNNTSTNTNNNNFPNYGTHITGSTTGANGFDATSAGDTSLFTFDQKSATQQWIPVSNTNNTNLDAQKGYQIFIRGNRSVDLTATANSSSSNTTLRATGKILTGDQTFTNLEKDGRLSLVTNPYACSINWNSIYNDNSTTNATNFENYFIYWDPNIGTTGGYVSVNTNGTKSALSNATVDIQPGEAFFVVTKRRIFSPVFTIKENHKSDSSNVDIYHYAIPVKLKTSLYFTDADGVRTMADGVTTVFAKGYSTAINRNNKAIDFANPNENIAIARNGQRLSIEERIIRGTSDTLPLIVERLKAQNYEWQFDPTQFVTRIPAFLEDNYLKTRTPFSLLKTSVIPFTVNADSASFSRDRFQVVFGIITKPNADTTKGDFQIYPNPVTGNSFNLHFNNVDKGIYTVRVISATGQILTSKAVTHTGGTATLIIPISTNLSKGMYLVNITGANKAESKSMLIQ